jgi:hypothetical protein
MNHKTIDPAKRRRFLKMGLGGALYAARGLFAQTRGRAGHPDMKVRRQDWWRRSARRLVVKWAHEGRGFQRWKPA